jgi:hypothetical protein
MLEQLAKARKGVTAALGDLPDILRTYVLAGERESAGKEK